MSVTAMSWAWKLSLPSTEKLVLLALSDHANDENYTCWPSLNHLAKKTGLSRTAIWRAIDRLVEKNTVSRLSETDKASTVYQLKVGADVTYVTSAPGVGADVTSLGNVGNKLGADVTSNHKKHHEPSLKHIRGATSAPRELSEGDNHKKNGKFILPDWIPREAWDGWIEMRKKTRTPNTDRALTLTVKRLDELRQQGHDPGAVLDQSVERGWKGVFPLKSNGGFLASQVSRTSDFRGMK